MMKQITGCVCVLATLWATEAAAVPRPELVLQIGHQRAAENASIIATAFSPDGRWVASAGGPAFQSGEVKVWSARTGSLWRTLPASADMDQVVFSPDSRNVAAVGDGGTWIWRVSDGVRQRFWPARETRSRSIAFSPDGSTLFGVGIGHASARDWRSNRVLWSLPEVSFTRLAISQDGKALAASGFSNAVELRQASTGKLLRTLEPEKRDVNDDVDALAFSPDGSLVAAASNARLRVWEAETGRLLQSWKGHTGEGRTLAFAPDGRLISGGRDRLLRWWQPRTAHLSHTVRWPNEAVLSLAPSPDGKRVAVVDLDNLRLWDDGAGRFAWHAPRGLWPVGGAGWSPDGRALAVPAQDDTLRLWDVAAGRLRRTMREPSGIQGSAAFSPDGKLLANAGFVFLSLWDVASAKRLRSLEGGVASTAPSFSPDGSLLAFGDTQDGPVRVWDVRSGQRLWEHEGQGPSAFGTGGREVIGVGKWSNRIEVWDARNGRVLRTLSDLPLQPNGAPSRQSSGVFLHAIAPGGTSLACTVPVSTPDVAPREPGQPSERLLSLQLWSADGKNRRTLGTLRRVWPAAFSPNGKLLAVRDGTRIRIWDTASACEMAGMEVGTRELDALAFSPDSCTLACTGEDGLVTLRRVRDGKTRATLLILPSRNLLDFSDYAAVDWIAWTPDGFYLASPGARDFVRWRAGDALLPSSRFEAHFRRPDIVRRALGAP